MWYPDPAIRAAAAVRAARASLYGLGWLFLPHPDGRIHAQQLLTGRITAGFVGALLATLAVTDGVTP